MAKVRTKYICQQCGGEQNKWMGKCPDCGTWNTLEEVVDVPQSPAQQRRQTLTGNDALAQGTRIPVVLPQIKPLAQPRISVGYPEMDRVLGGGLVAGSLILDRRRTRYREINAAPPGLGRYRRKCGTRSLYIRRRIN